MNHLSQNQGKKRLNTHTKDRALHMINEKEEEKETPKCGLISF